MYKLKIIELINLYVSLGNASDVDKAVQTNFEAMANRAKLATLQSGNKNPLHPTLTRSIKTLIKEKRILRK